jgi:hypothetical protein
MATAVQPLMRERTRLVTASKSSRNWQHTALRFCTLSRRCRASKCSCRCSQSCSDSCRPKPAMVARNMAANGGWFRRESLLYGQRMAGTTSPARRPQARSTAHVQRHSPLAKRKPCPASGFNGRRTKRSGPCPNDNPHAASRESSSRPPLQELSGRYRWPSRYICDPLRTPSGFRADLKVHHAWARA